MNYSSHYCDQEATKGRKGEFGLGVRRGTSRLIGAGTAAGTGGPLVASTVGERRVNTE